MRKSLLFPVAVAGITALAAPHRALAQTPKAPATAAAESWQDRLFGAPDMVLPILYEAAINHSADIERLEAAKQVAGQDIQLARKQILSHLSLNGTYSYGTLPYFSSTDGGAPRVNGLNAFSMDARAQYLTGVSLALPFDMFSTRRITIRKQELMLQQASAERKVGESDIRRQVIVLYQDLVLAKTNLQHYQDAVQSASLSKKLADNQFRNGEIQIAEQMAALDFYNKATLAQAEARNKYQTALLLLEDLVGAPLNVLMTNR